MLFATTAESPDFGYIVMYLLGGLAIFLFGMDQMSDALKVVAGNGMKKVLARLTTNRFTGAIAGAFVTAVIQSSSVTTVLVVGFISAGLISLSQSIGVIMGANVGTTITAQIVAFKVTSYALVLVAVGFAMLFAIKNDKIKHYGHMTMGLGMIFFGMYLMSEGTKPLRTYQPFIDMMQSMDNPLMAILVAAAFTALVQSSSATTGIVIALASNGYISVEGGIALIFGANIGTCVTAMLAAIGKPREAVRAATVHVAFNFAGVLLWFMFIGQLASVVQWVSPSASPERIAATVNTLRESNPNLTGAELAESARRASETPRQIANAHTVFNVANTFIFIWFTAPLAWLVTRIVPDKSEVTEEEVSRPKYLDAILLQTPSLALDIVRMELGRLGAAALVMVRGALGTVVTGTSDELVAMEHMDNDVDALHAAIVTYMGRLSQENLGEAQAEKMQNYLSAANYMENIGDIIETNLVACGRERLKQDFSISVSTQNVLEELHDKVCWAVEQSIQALVGEDREMARQVMGAKGEVAELAASAEYHVSRRLAADAPNRLAAFRLESEIIEYLKRIYYFAKRISKLAGENNIEANVEQPAHHQPEDETEPAMV